ncbi:MAG: outer membrane protein assembly factor BamA [Rhodospirillales bacterium]|nr:outer membrane protein assembly factor BamA [Rhodospirillales bacterium]
MLVALAATSELTTVPTALAQQQQVVREVVIEGVQRIEPDTVRSYLLVREGDEADPERIDRSLKSLYGTGLFSDVSIQEQGSTLVVRVVENPIVNRVAFEGNRHLKDENLESEVTLKPRSIFTRTKVQSDVQRLLTLYRQSGRFAATVEPKIIELPQNRVDVVFEINEGPVTAIETIRFIGNEAFSDSRLREVIRTKQSRWWRFLSSDDTYDPDRLALDRELLRRFYLSEGYVDFRVQSAVAELTPNREEFFLTFTVEEGDRYRVGNVNVSSMLPGLQKESLTDVVTFSEGDWYDANQVEKTIDKLSEAAGNLGYAFVDVRPRLERDREKKTINIVFEVKEGPRVYVERIDITGNVRTMDKVIRREFRLVEGDAFNAAKLRRSRQRIQDLDFFEKVSVEQVPGSAPDKAVVKVAVEEKSTGSLSVGAGFSTGSGFLGDISLRERNFLGRGQDVQASVMVGQRQQQVDLSFTEPYFLGKEIAAGGDLFFVQTDRQDESSFDTTTIGGDLRANYPLTEHLRQGWRYTLKQTDVNNVPNDASVFIKEAEGKESYSEVSHSLTYDRRDSRINPTEGYYAKHTIDVAGLGGSAKYVRNRVDAGYYYPVSEKWVLSLSGSGGIVQGLGEDVKLLDRFYIGGNEIRGFSTDGIGPRDKDTNDALGGEYFWASSLQLSFPLGLPEELDIRGRVFTDVGSAWKMATQGRNDLVDDSAAPRLSVGAGLTWVSPFGPLGIDLGFALLKESFDDTEILRLNFGTRF